MLDIGWSELIVIGVVALIVVGPKDLPVMFQRVGQFVGKARHMARDFQRAMNDAADQAGVKDLKKSVDMASSMKNLGLSDIKDHMENLAPDFSDPDVAKAGAAKEAASNAAFKAEGAAKLADNDMTAAPAAKKPAAKKAGTKKAATKSAAKTAAKATGKAATATKNSAKTAAKTASKAKAASKPAATKKPAAKKPAAKKTTKKAAE